MLAKQQLANLFLSAIYAATICWIYIAEILVYWAYMGFEGSGTLETFGVSIGLSVALALFLPPAFNTRAIAIYTLHYVFFIPSIVIMVFSGPSPFYIISIIIVIAAYMGISKLRIPLILFPPIKRKSLFALIIGLVIFAVVLQAAFGGLRYFSLDLEAVYKFRRTAAAEMPGIFGYIFSNVSNVLIPLASLFAARFKSWPLVIVSVGSAILLFGMTHHKSVFFTPFFVLGLYIFLGRLRKPSALGILFCALVAISVIEILYGKVFSKLPGPGLYTSYFIRRILLVPPMLDNEFISFFSNEAKYFWSTSKIGLGIASNPWGTAAPLLIGREVFGNSDMSANTGIIGSGYSNAGIFGVAIYAVLSGMLIGTLNKFGHRLGHAFVASASLITVVNITTTTDLTTALLSHGLLLLLCSLACMPRMTDAAGSDQKCAKEENKKLEIE